VLRSTCLAQVEKNSEHSFGFNVLFIPAVKDAARTNMAGGGSRLRSQREPFYLNYLANLSFLKGIQGSENFRVDNEKGMLRLS